MREPVNLEIFCASDELGKFGNLNLIHEVFYPDAVYLRRVYLGQEALQVLFMTSVMKISEGRKGGLNWGNRMSPL